jgi:hypothetical protein
MVFRRCIIWADGFVLRDASLRAAPQDEDSDPHGEEPRLRGVSNHEASGEATMIRVNRKML